MPQPCPPCKNPTCPHYKSNERVRVLIETREHVTFGCLSCRGVEVRTLDWRRAAQERSYRDYGRPEYARTRRFFFQGRHQHTGG